MVNIYRFQVSTGASGLDKVMGEGDDTPDAKVDLKTAHMTIKEIAAINYARVNKALMKYPVFKFSFSFLPLPRPAPVFSSRSWQMERNLLN